MQLRVKFYTYDLYDMVDIAMLAEGDTIILRGEEVLITSLVRTDFIFTDKMDLDNTTIVIKDGQVIEMERIYTP